MLHVHSACALQVIAAIAGGEYRSGLALETANGARTVLLTSPRDTALSLCLADLEFACAAVMRFIEAQGHAPLDADALGVTARHFEVDTLAGGAQVHSRGGPCAGCTYRVAILGRPPQS